MKKKSLQQIEDFYINLGYEGNELRKVLEKDKKYQLLFKQRKEKLNKKYKINPIEKKKYVLSTDEDFEILNLCKKLEKFNLSNEDRILVKIIKTQLEHNWRFHLLKSLNKIFEKYSS